jgi:Tfp pilus assembly protein PilF
MPWHSAALSKLALVLAFGLVVQSATGPAFATETFEHLYARAIEARNVGDFSAAEGLLREAVAMEPSRADAVFLLA